MYAFEIANHGGTTLWQHGHLDIQESGTMDLVAGRVFNHVKYDIDIVIVDLPNSL